MINPKKPLVLLLFLGTLIPQISAQSEAISILPNGNVGIGKLHPISKLDVQGSMNADSVTLNGALTAREAHFSDSISANSGIFNTSLHASNGTFAQNVTADDAKIGDMGFTGYAGFSHKDVVNPQTSYGLLQSADGSTTLLNVNSGSGHIGFRVDNEDKVVINAAGNMGIGTTAPESALHVVGGILATEVNGELPPRIIKVGDKSVPNSWQGINVDIGAHCGDANGCTMRILLADLNTDEVRVRTETMFIEQASMSNDKTPGLSGWTRQLGGEDNSFILDTTAEYNLILYPWDWIYMRNFGNANLPNLPQGVYTGYNVQFMVPPTVIAVVYIYD